MSEWTLQEEWQLEEINAARAALLLAREIAYPQLDIAYHLSLLAELAEEAGDQVNIEDGIIEQGEQLASFLFNILAFEGDQLDYYNPRNSFLNDVLEKRTGLPISLSVIYIDIANRLGLPAYGIGLPGHFIVGLRDGNESHWLDPYHGGRWLTLNDCAELIQVAVGYEGPLDASWFLPASSREILIRMMHNLRAAYVHKQWWDKAAAVIKQLRLVEPQTAEHLRDLGLIYYRQQSLPKAAYFLNEYLAQAPNATDATMIRQGMRDALDGWAPLN
ncbi:MAG: transglutaminase-like domain-containing protein [Chloroflexota bacterium]